MTNTFELNQVVYIEVTGRFSDRTPKLLPYFISRVNITNVHAIPLKHQEQYNNEGAKDFGYAKVVFNPKNLKVLKHPSLYTHKIYMSEADYENEQQEQQRYQQLYAQALEKLKTLTTQELENFVK